jgi:thioesterase domain-containing protein
MKTPANFTCGIPGVSALYKNEVQRRQPKGPYNLGGRSTGGVVAYKVAQQLIQRGEKVERLISLDSPCPIRLGPLPARLQHFLDQIGLLGTGAGEAPEWLLPHFDSAIKALDEYKPTLMDAKTAPKTFAIWATNGVCENP